LLLKHFLWALPGCILCGLLSAHATGGDPALRDLQRHQQQREQQQHELQLRMLQQQRDAQRPAPATLERDIEQRRQQEQLHYRQQIAPPSGQPSDDADTQRGTAQIDDERARREREQQLRRFESERLR
jgi:hypothetical protein